MLKFGGASSLSIGQGLLPTSVQSSMTVIKGSTQDPLESIVKLGKTLPDTINQVHAGDGKLNVGFESFRLEDVPSKLSPGTRTEKIINGFLQDPILREENTELHERVCIARKILYHYISSTIIF